MRCIKLLICLLLSASSLSYSATIPAAILDYTTATTEQMIWMNQRFIYKIDGNNPNNSSVVWTYYRDLKGLATLGQYLNMKDFAAANGYDYTKMVLHAKINYTSTVWHAWSGMDQFGVFEGANGILLEPSTGTYTDRTGYAYSGGYTTTINSTLYIGYEEPFDRANFVFNTAAVGLSGTWQYWNGTTWATLTVTDGTSAMTQNGTIVFTPPSSWARTSINSSRTKYFIRFAYTSATTSPIVSTIKGDPWMDGDYACRGWSFTDANRVNTGTALEYNPTPPAGSSAKFPYQAQMSFWGDKHSSYNSGYKVNGTRATIHYLTYILNQAISVGYTGTMLDEANALPTLPADGIDYSDTDFPDYSANNMITESEQRLGELITAVHAISPTFKIGVNGQEAPLIKNTSPKPDWNLAEYHTYAWNTGGSRGIVVGESSDGTYTTMSYDDYLPANNPSGMIGVLIYRDSADNGYVWGNNPGRPWDMANRGPIAALSKHLIAYNSNTIFSYHSNNSTAVYSETDQVILTDDSVVNLSTTATPAVANVKRWATWFPAMGVDFGAPTTARDFAWKLGADIGGGTDVWRRDWTNAIILHRPGQYGVTDEQFNTPSSAIDLGGTYYPLYADGTVGAGITSITLRCNEGSILMTSNNLASNGTCGSASGGSFPTLSQLSTNLCSSGSVASFTGSGPWTWGCNGSNGGTSTSSTACSATYAAVVLPVTSTNKPSGNYKASQSVSLSTNGTSTTYCKSTSANCTPATSYSTAVKVLTNIPYEKLCYQSTDGTNTETTVCKDYYKREWR